MNAYYAHQQKKCIYIYNYITLILNENLKSEFKKKWFLQGLNCIIYIHP